jgi:c(7)-type cytochrome triheme protein
MINFAKDLGRTFVTHGRVLLITFGSVILALLLIGVLLEFQTHRAGFCASCHYMEPYVRHWKTSNHKDVTCVKCHDYGVGSLTLSALKYVTGTYTLRPKANVHDESCLSSGCHEVRLLQGEVTYRKGILFDHTVHLEKALRGEKLRCTSCHNQIVQYDQEVTAEHMAVNDKSCFVCHFKDAGQGEAITGCDACHGMPKDTVMHAGFAFDHRPYLTNKVECKQCHTKIVKGDGAVPESRCYSCHVERARAEYTREQLHAIHVTTNGIDCFRCHSDIEHGNFEMVSSLEIQCESCHLRQHNRPKQLYMGIGGRDSLDIPSAMFMAQVSCTGCHTHITPQGEPMAAQDRKEAQRASCVTCHGKGYDLMFDNWRSGTQTVLSEYAAYLQALTGQVAALGNSATARRAKAALDTATYNYDFVREGHLPHNIRYSLYLLNSSGDRVEAALKATRSGYQPPDRGKGLKPENSCVMFCHGSMPPKETVAWEGKTLPHAQHIKDAEVACVSCHSVKEHGKVQIDRTVCKNCHEW